MDWMLLPYRRYFDFSGRSRRKEYWMFALLNVIVSTIFYAIMVAGGGAGLLTAASMDPTLAAAGDPFANVGPLFWIGFIGFCLWALATVIPSIAVTVRRLHDRNLTGWLYLAVCIAQFIPFVGIIAAIALLVVMVLPGTPGPNKYGFDPKQPASVEVFE